MAFFQQFIAADVLFIAMYYAIELVGKGNELGRHDKKMYDTTALTKFPML